jgi:hypothetical protein
MRRRISRGYMLMELLMAGLIAVLVGIGLIALIQTTYTSQGILVGENASYSSTRQALNILSDHIRNAQSYQTVASPATYQAVSAGTATSITLYTNASTGDTERYWLDTTVTPNALKLTTTVSSVATTSTVLTGVTR